MRRLLMTFIPLFAVAGLAACGSDVSTSSTASSAPGTTAPGTTAPDTTAPDTTLPDTTAPATTAAVTTTTPVDAAIVLGTPRDGDRWVDPMVIAGTADTFEATVNFQVVGADGTVLQEGVTMASCGTGCRGVFSQQLDPLPAGTTGPVTIRVFDYSEADGSVIDLVEVTVTA